MAEFSYYLRGEGTDKDKKTVTVRFTHNKKHFERATKARVLAKDFDSEKGRVKIAVEDAATLNRQIEVVRERFDQAAEWVVKGGYELNVENFRMKYQALEKAIDVVDRKDYIVTGLNDAIIADLEVLIAKKENELAAYRRKLILLKSPKGIEHKRLSRILDNYQESHKQLSQLTKNGYLVTMRMFEKHLPDGILVDELNPKVLLDALNKEVEAGKRNSTLYQHVMRLKAAINYYVDQYDPEFDTKFLDKVGVGESVNDKPVIYLNPKELKEIEELELPHPRLDYVRDLFLLSCYTGLRHVDLHISEDDIEDDYIQVLASKTKRQFSLPFSKKANFLMQRMRDSGYDYNPQRVGNFSRLVKEVCSYAPSLARLRPVTLVKETPEKPVEKKPKWELMSSKVGRKTFINNCLLKNVRIEVVADWVGHSNLKMIQNHYSHKRSQSEAERHKIDSDF